MIVARRPGVEHTFTNVYNEGEFETNGLIQAISIDLANRKRITGAYVSLHTTAATLTEILTNFITSVKGREWLIGDLNERDTL